MNKIVIDKENNIDIKDNVVDLEINVPELTINIKGSVLINEMGKKDNNLKLTLNIFPKTSLIYNRFMIHNENNEIITINQESDSDVEFNYSLIAKEKCEIELNSNLKGNNNITGIYVKAVTEDKGNCLIKSTADTMPKIIDNELVESIKVLMLNDEESVCTPNLLVSSNEIEVNHAATISGIDKDDLFYLCSKGLSEEKATILLKNGFLLNNLDINEKIKNEIQDLIGG